MSEKIVQGADGQLYKEVKDVHGELEYIPVTQEEANDQLSKQYLDSSRDHELYFKNLELQSSNDPKFVKQDMRRMKALNRRLSILEVDRVMPPQSPLVEFIKDEKLIDLITEYNKCVQAGTHKESEFQPLSAYVNKLSTKSGKIVRQLYKGECGMKGGVVLCLEQGYGVGNFEQVPEKIGE